MFLLGVVDDIISLKPSTKLIAEIVVASALVLVGQRLHWTEMQTADMLLTIVWLVGVTNAFNILDNMDGLCAGVALMAGVALLFGLLGRPEVEAETRYLVILLGATTGFFLYNIYPASIFMGDGGSLFLGMTLAGLTLTSGEPDDEGSILSILAAPLLVLLIPIVDTTLVAVSRLLSGRPVSQGGRDHSSHRLVAIGLSERNAVRVLWVLAAVAGAIGSTVQRFSTDWAWLLGAVFILGTALCAAYLAGVRVYEPSELPPRGVTPVVIDFMYKRRVAEVLLDVCLITIAYYAAWRLRFEGPEWEGQYFARFLQSLPIALASQLVWLFVLGAYRGAWKYFGLMDGVAFGKAIAAGTMSLVVAVVYLYRFENYSRGVFVIHAALLMLMLCTSRASFRLIGEFVRRGRTTTARLVIYGAGEASSLLVRELLTSASHEHYQIIGFIDDDSSKRTLRLQGYAVLGAEAALLKLIENREVDVVVLASRHLEAGRLQRVEEMCRRCDVRLLRFTLSFQTLVSPA